MLSDVQRFEAEHDVRLIRKADSLLMRLISNFLGKSFIWSFWTTYRLPFGKPIIAYPTKAKNPLSSNRLEHELMHAEDMRSTWGAIKMFFLLWLLPLPIIFSGRWFIERRAYGPSP
jgi:hypothetical protein